MTDTPRPLPLSGPRTGPSWAGGGGHGGTCGSARWPSPTTAGAWRDWSRTSSANSRNARAEREGTESKLSHLADLRARLVEVGLAPLALHRAFHTAGLELAGPTTVTG